MNKDTIKPRSSCAISCALDIFGDKWTLLIIRDLLMGARKYNDFLRSDEKITTNILASRLKKLEQHGIISKSVYQENPPRYEYSLAEKGAALLPVLESIVHWSNDYVPDVPHYDLACSQAPSK